MEDKKRDGALEVHVSPAGNDANPGTGDRPIKTLVRARDMVRSERSTGMSRRVEVVLHGGTYCLEESLLLGQQDGGTREAPVVWRAAAGERPVISGGVPVTGWTRHEGGIFAAPAPERIAWHGRARQLFYRGNRMRRSRWPKFDVLNPHTGGWAFPEGPVDGAEYAAFRFRAGTFPRRYRKPAQAEVTIYAGDGWCNATIPVLAIDWDRRIVRLDHSPMKLDWQPWFMDPRFGETSRFYIANAVEEVTDPGDWCYDSDENTVYFIPPDDAVDDDGVTVPILDTLVRMRDAEWLTLRGLTFTCTTTGDDYHPQGVLGLGAMLSQQGWRYCGEAVELRGTRHCRIEECSFDQVGGNAIYLNRDNHRARVSRNTISKAGANGVVLAGDRAFHPMFCEVTDNDIGEAGYLINYVAGVFLGLSDGCTVAHNSLHDLPHHAVNLASNGIGRNYVEYNEIRRVCLDIYDTGAINSWMDVPSPWIDVYEERSGHVIRNNLISDVRGCIVRPDGTAEDRSVRGIYLDDCTSNCVVTDNIIVHVGMGLQVHAGKHNLVENNIVLDCHTGVAFCDAPPRRPGNQHILGMFRGNRFVRNIVVTRKRDPFVYEFDAWTDNVVERCDENTFHFAASAAYRVQIEKPEGRIVSSFADWHAMGYDEASVVGDPLFVDAEHEDFRLRPESPALALGFRQIDTAEIGIRRSAD